VTDRATLQRRPVRRSVVPPVLIAVGIVVVLFLIRILSPLGAPVSASVLQDLLTLTYSVIIESLPFVILGIVLSIVVQVWIPDAWVARVLPGNPILRRVMISFLGVFFPVCECGNVPLARGLMLKGFSVSESMTFLLAAPIVNPITIITTYQAFGFDDGILVARILGGFAIANLIGWVFSRHPDPDRILTPGFAAECSLPDDHSHATSRWQESVTLFAREAAVIMPVLVIGALIAGLVQVGVPRSVLVELGGNPLWSILAMLVLAFIISVCSNVDAFFILPFASTFLPGSIVTFLVFGPIIDVKMLALMRTTFTTRTLVQIAAIVALASAILGLGVNLIA
jgi:uncharacterized membrane protein YraQ (UPF0718 family)